MTHRSQPTALFALIAALGTTASALGVSGVTPPPPPSTGDDVVVSGIGNNANASAPFGESTGSVATTNGTVGSIKAFSVSTVSCNIGNADAIWFAAPSNQHPVIGTQLYKYTTANGGRMEMIGLNWLKHGFCAADAANCTQITSPFGALIANSSCNYLGEFATDTYSASLNGTQSNMGPRSEVNPWTGAYVYPPTNISTTGDAVFKRVQVNVADLDAANTYVFEVTYVTTDESGANRYNNCSYRKATWDAVNNRFNFSGSTQAYLPAVAAWQVIDPAVTLVNIDPYGTGAAGTDGRFVLGYKVTALGGNQWQYEYALFNMNNDHAAQAFSVPVDARTNLTSPGWHAPLWHSGEVYNNTPWTFSNSGGIAQWAMVNDNGANSNALRWSVTQNYRFIANQPPVAGNATIQLFKTGAVSSVLVPTQVPAIPPPGGFDLVSPAPGATGVSTTPFFTWNPSAGALTYTLTVATDAALSNVAYTSSGMTGTVANIPSGADLAYSSTYYWAITAVGASGNTQDNQGAASFVTIPAPCIGDINGDGHTNTFDLGIMLKQFGNAVPVNTEGDLNGDGVVNSIDLGILLSHFGC